MAISNTCVWEVRTDGTTTNGGGFVTGGEGTDFSQQAAAEHAYTDLVIDGITNTDITSVARPFSSVDVGNIIYISGGTGFTTGWFEIKSIQSGSKARLDRSAGTLGSTGGTANLGGALTALGTLTAMFTATDRNKIWIKAGTHPVGSGAGFALVKRFEVEGYNTTRGDIDPHLDDTTNCPVLQGSGVQVLTFASGSQGDHCYVKNVIIDANDVASSVGIYVSGSGNVVRNAKVINWKTNGANCVNAQQPTFDRVHFAGDASCIGAAINLGTGSLRMFNCNISDINTHAIGMTGGSLWLFGCQIWNLVGGSYHGISGSSTEPNFIVVQNSVFYNIAGGGIVHSVGTNGRPVMSINNVFMNITGTAIDVNTANHSFSTSDAFRACGTKTTGVDYVEKSVDLSGDPFVDAPNGDFTINASTPAGKELAGTGWPQTIPSVSTQVNPSRGNSFGKTANRGDQGGTGGFVEGSTGQARGGPFMPL